MVALGKVASPCIGVCQLDPGSGLCQGCLRSLDEIARWRAASDWERHIILGRIAERRGEQVRTTPVQRRA